MGRAFVVVVACLCLFACARRSKNDGPGGSGTAGAAGGGGGAAGADGGTGVSGMAGRAGIAGTAGNATTGVGGNGASTGTTGTGGAAGSAATGSAGTTGTGGTIGNGGTTGGAGASGAGGGAGAAGTGGGAGAAGTGGRGGATGGGGGSGGAGGTQTAMQIAAVLDGQQWLVPCGADLSLSNLVCVDYPTGGCPSRAAGPARWPSGYLSRNDHLTFGGTPGKTYDVTVRIRGIVEVGAYQNGTTESGHDGWYIGGEPKDYSSFSAYNVYALTVSSPVAVPSALASGQFYFLNAVNHPQAHYSYAIDYTVTISIDAGAEIGFFANSLNCRAIKNCDNTSVEKGGNYSGCNPITIADLPASTGITQPYYGQFMVMNVVSAVER